MATQRKLSRRMTTLLIMLGVAIIIGVLIAYEQISALYVLCSLALIVLLLVVGFADLEGVTRRDTEGTGEV
ncbi:MAG TPA: hypothetical protein VL501_08295 [Pyrinomonadaceae bacterium]|nr:hypothetical protein [Pyrinomonadaceae bacterium]